MVSRGRAAHGGRRRTCSRAESVESRFRDSDIICLPTPLLPETRHLVSSETLALMKPDAVLVNTSRGPVIDEAALVEHLKANPDFRAGLDVFEKEPEMAEGLAGIPNCAIVPHIASATTWTREGMATLAACNVAAVLQGYGYEASGEIGDFLEGDVPRRAPSILNATDLGI